MSAISEAWPLLDRGKPHHALGIWREQLLQSHRCLAYIEAAHQALPQDPLAGQRRLVLRLLAQLQAGVPGEAEISLLGEVLRGWAALCLDHAPGRSLQLLERAWACGSDPQLDQQLADLYARQGLAAGAHALAVPQPHQPPWPQRHCAGLHCQPCSSALAANPLSEEPDLQIHALEHGRIWIERHVQLGQTHGVAVAQADGRLIPALVRRYPWHWPDCRVAEQDRLLSLALMAHPHHRPASPLQRKEPVLAVADLSAELYYHAQLELLPRLGRAWQQLSADYPGLRLWHNGGSAPWMTEAFSHLGIPAERLLCAHRHPHLQASLLLVPSYSSSFGRPGARSLDWLRGFWGAVTERLPNADTSRPAAFLSRSLDQRRPLLQHQQWLLAIPQYGLHRPSLGRSVAEQLRAFQRTERVVMAHGGAMANLLLMPPGSEVIELMNPGYQPPYITSLLASANQRHRSRLGAITPQILQDLLYAGPLEWPIDLDPTSDQLLPEA